MNSHFSQRRRVVVIYNPVAGAGKRGRLLRFLRLLRRAGHRVRLRRTTMPGDGAQIAAGLDAQSVDVVVAAGGDGTINEVAKGLAGGTLPLAIAPLGTANVMAWELGLGPNIAQAARCVADGDIVPVRLMQTGGRALMLMVSAGLDARVVAGVSDSLKHRFGKLAYGLVWAREILRAPCAPIHLSVDGVAHSAALVVVTHAARYAGPFVIAPAARLGQDRLSVVMLAHAGRLAMIGYALAMITNLLPRLPSVQIVTGQSIEFTTPTGAAVQGDGDSVGRVPLSITLSTASVNLIVPDAARVRA